MYKDKQKFRASYSILSKWAGGQWEEAIKMYFKLETYTSPQMAEGKKWHEKWDIYITTNKALPLELGGKILISPITELKKVVNLQHWLDLVGVIDCYDNNTVYEFKTGKQSSDAYASSKQLSIYGLLCTYAGLYVEKAEIYHFDQYIGKYDMSVIWITDNMLKDAYNWIETLSSEMHSYFIENDLYNKYA